MTITMKEIIGDIDINYLPSEHQTNLHILHEKINKLRALYGKPMIVSSGLRSLQKHKEIYLKKGIPEDKIPMKSKHLSGEAVDIYDPNKELQTFIKSHIPEMVAIGLWFEDFEYTPSWAHIQIVAPRSRSRFFIP